MNPNRRLIPATLAAVLPLSGCGEPADSGGALVGPHEPVSAQPEHARVPEDAALEAALKAAGRHTARTAAQIVTSMPAVTDPAARRELQLHVLLYRAAHETNVGDFTRHFLLDPQPKDAALSIDETEFRLRVLAGLADLGVPVAWARPATRPDADPDSFPGTRHLATHLGFSLEERTDGGSRIRGRITDRTAHVATSSQKVTAVWIGGGWSLERDPVRIVY